MDALWELVTADIIPFLNFAMLIVVLLTIVYVIKVQAESIKQTFTQNCEQLAGIQQLIAENKVKLEKIENLDRRQAAYAFAERMKELKYAELLEEVESAHLSKLHSDRNDESRQKTYDDKQDAKKVA
jgi:hypothetical protein